MFFKRVEFTLLYPYLLVYVGWDVMEYSGIDRKEYAKIFQRANRRIQNIERAIEGGRLGYSPAYDSVMQYTGRYGVYSKFHMVSDEQQMREQYAQAMAFLNEPTSTASGARQWQREMMRGVTRKNGKLLTEREMSSFMRAVYSNSFANDTRFQEIAEHYVLGSDEIYSPSDESDYGFDDALEDAADAANFFSGSSLTEKEKEIGSRFGVSSRTRHNKRRIAKAITKFIRL